MLPKPAARGAEPCFLGTTQPLLSQLKGSTWSCALPGHRGTSTAQLRTCRHQNPAWHSHVEGAAGPAAAPVFVQEPASLPDVCRVGTAERSWPLINQKANRRSTSAAWSCSAALAGALSSSRSLTQMSCCAGKGCAGAAFCSLLPTKSSSCPSHVKHAEEHHGIQGQHKKKPTKKQI